jgi:hypothetical protein
MAVNREWRCTFHDHEFESFEDSPRCPYGCGPKFVVMEFRSPPSIRHSSTANTDAVRRQLAADYNLTDVRGDKDGSSVMSNTPTSSGGARQIGEQKPYWGDTGKMFGGKQGWAQAGERAPNYDVRALRGPLVKSGNSYVQRYPSIKEISSGAQTHLRRATRMMRERRS